MTNILTILEKWGIKVPQENYYIEYLSDCYPDKIMYIDQCPFSVGDKHSQVDIFFQEVLDGTLEKGKFMHLEVKYRNILTKLWLYNNVFAESNIANVNIKNRLKVIDKQYLNLYPKLFSKFTKSSFVNIVDKVDLELLIQLGARDIINAAFYFEEYELLIIPSWSCLIVYFNNLNKVNIVEKIINIEGLYLRSSISDGLLLN